MANYKMPDGTEVNYKPKDGTMFQHRHSNQIDEYVWDGLMELWYYVSTAFVMPAHWPTQHFITIDLESMIDCECGNKESPVGQGHSGWCKRYRKEF